MHKFNYFCSFNQKIMKRFLTAILTLIMTFSLAIPSEARKKEEGNELIRIFESYEETEGVEYFNLEGFLLKMARPTIRKSPVGKAADGIENLCIFSISEVGKELRNRFTKEAEGALQAYEMVLETKEDKQTSRIYMKKQNAEIIDELIVYALGEDIALIYIRGEIPVSALEGMTPETETGSEQES